MKLLKLIIGVLLSLTSLQSIAAGNSEKYNSAVKHFAWGVEAGAAIDMTSNDLSTANIGAFFGYRNSIIDMLGIGAEINMMVEDNNQAFPVYAVFRSNFRSIPTACFLDLRLGAVFNNVGDTDQTRLFVSPGLGINLAKGKSFQSYVALSYVFNGLRPYSVGKVRYDVNGLHMAAIRLGIAF